MSTRVTFRMDDDLYAELAALVEAGAYPNLSAAIRGELRAGLHSPAAAIADGQGGEA